MFNFSVEGKGKGKLASNIDMSYGDYVHGFAFFMIDLSAACFF